MAEMRAWFDHNRVEPATFEHSSGGPGIAFRLSFLRRVRPRLSRKLSTARLTSVENPMGAALWEVEQSPSH
jgi:hypothetical protein